MSWDGVLTTLDTHLATAAGVVNALDTSKDLFSVRRGEPSNILQRQVAFWYEGDDEARNTLSASNVEERVTIRWYWPVLNRDAKFSSYVEGQLQAANRATQSALYGDTHLDENCIALRIDRSSTGWQQVGEAWVRVLSIPIRIEMVDVAVISN